MRELKFRAWDQLTGKMYYNVQDMYDGWSEEEWSSDEIYLTGIPTTSFGAIISSKIPVMQYTGLKDKKGFEIYEGDIVRTETGVGEVWDRLGCWFVSLGKELGYYNDQIEIIGNIYENPELLSTS